MEYAYPSLPPMAMLAMTIYATLISATVVCFFFFWRRRTPIWPIMAFVLSPIAGLLVASLFPPPPETFEWTNSGCRINILLGLFGLACAYFRRVGLQAAPIFMLVIFVAIVSAVLQPGIRTRPIARRMECLSNLHNLMVAVQNYASVNHGQLPSPGFSPADLSWRVQILPLMDHAALYRAYQRDKSWDDPANDEFTKLLIKAYSCPSNPILKDAQGRYFTAYAFFTGPSTASNGSDSLTLDDLGMMKGLSQTMLIGEACGANIVWNEPRDIDVSRDRPGVNLPGKTRGTSDGWLSSYHKDAVNVVFADGSTKTLSANIDPDVLKALTSIDPANRLKENELP